MSAEMNVPPQEEIVEKFFFNVSQSPGTVKDKDKVIIVDYDEKHLYVRTKESQDRLKILNEKIKRLDRQGNST